MEKKRSLSGRIKESLATGFFVGYIPWMPGTFGTLVGVILYIIFSRYIPYYYVLVAVVLVVAVWVSDYAEKHIFKAKDVPQIVIDEIIGFMISMSSRGGSPWRRAPRQSPAVPRTAGCDILCNREIPSTASPPITALPLPNYSAPTVWA